MIGFLKLIPNFITMDKVYLPKSLVESGLDPVFDYNDITYRKFVKDGKTIRVDKLDPVEGKASILYPTANPDIFEGEVFHSVDQESLRIPVERSKIGDRIWIALLDNADIEKILSEFPLDMLGLYPSGSYRYGNGSMYRTFHVVEKEEP
jgi:hypothetical protein